jgi:Phage integrase, N-terminal SAM-like domain
VEPLPAPRTRAPRTIGNYLDQLRLAEAWTAADGRSLTAVTKDDLEEHLSALATQLQPSSVATQYKALRIFSTLIEHEDETHRARWRRCRRRWSPEDRSAWPDLVGGAPTSVWSRPSVLVRL